MVNTIKDRALNIYGKMSKTQKIKFWSVFALKMSFKIALVGVYFIYQN